MTQRALESIRHETLEVLRRHTLSGDGVALLDFPVHHNAGDSLIFAGEVQYLAKLNVRVDYVSDLATHDSALLAQRVGSRTILLNGGGNFGDRWPAHQLFRERIVARFPHNKIVGLPQGIEYSDPENLRKTAAIYAKHPDLTLMFREERSYEIAQTRFPDNNVEFCPDMAFGADIAQGPDASTVNVVKLLRADSERIDHGYVDIESSTAQYDWAFRGFDFALWQAVTLPTKIAYRYPRTIRSIYPALERAYPAMVALNLRAAQRILNNAPVVLTDRLHAAVLAAMMGKRVIAMDNANKKISGVYRAYLHRFDNVRYAASASEASELVAQAVSERR